MKKLSKRIDRQHARIDYVRDCGNKQNGIWDKLFLFAMLNIARALLLIAEAIREKR